MSRVDLPLIADLLRVLIRAIENPQQQTDLIQQRRKLLNDTVEEPFADSAIIGMARDNLLDRIGGPNGLKQIRDSKIDLKQKASLMELWRHLDGPFYGHYTAKEPETEIVRLERLLSLIESTSTPRANGKWQPATFSPNSTDEQPDEIDLTPKACDLLLAMLKLNAVGSSKKTTKDRIVHRINRKHTSDQYRDAFALLRKLDFAESSAGPPPTGGIWLTGKGKSKAQQLHSDQSNSSV